MSNKETPDVNFPLIIVMAVSCGLSVANLYYSQPLLADIQRDFGVSVREAGLIPMLTQVGYATGMLFFVPLGDMAEGRRLITTMLAAVACALLAAAVSPSFAWLASASLLIGLTTIVPQLIFPFAARLAGDEARGRTVGTVMSGLLLGILLARTLSGFVGARVGWRGMYGIAAGGMAVLALALRVLLPISQPLYRGSYSRLMFSLVALTREHATLREASFTGAMLFGSFSAFWTTLVFLLSQPPYHYGSRAAGLFGLVGAIGALGANAAGRLSSLKESRTMLRFAICLAALSFAVMWSLWEHLFGLVVGALLLDLGVQGGHVSNQIRIYTLSAEAHGRLNTVYMVSFFVGGAAGSSLGTLGWSLWRWNGVCVTGLVMLLLALVSIHLGKRAASRRRTSHDLRQ
jgi:predicted MFS family arabinose efflux permease